MAAIGVVIRVAEARRRRAAAREVPIAAGTAGMPATDRRRVATEGRRTPAAARVAREVRAAAAPGRITVAPGAPQRRRARTLGASRTRTTTATSTACR